MGDVVDAENGADKEEFDEDGNAEIGRDSDSDSGIVMNEHV